MDLVESKYRLMKDNFVAVIPFLMSMLIVHNMIGPGINTAKLNFVQFATQFKVVDKKLTKLPDNVVPRIFPTYSSNPKGPNFAQYCKCQLLRYKPWKISQVIK